MSDISWEKRDDHSGSSQRYETFIFHDIYCYLPAAFAFLCVVL